MTRASDVYSLIDEKEDKKEKDDAEEGRTVSFQKKLMKMQL